MTGHSSRGQGDREANTLNRRQLIGVGAGVGVTLLAGCSTQSEGSSGGEDETTDGNDGTTDGGPTESGTFRLLISDQPVAIGDFDSLNVSFDRARIFSGEADDGDENESEMEDEESEMDSNESEMEDEDSEMEGEDSESDAEAGGFSVIDLDGATVDLTQVVGDKAIGVFEGELSAGRYSKIELYASNVAGVVDGESVDVKIPSGKLQIVKPFEITPDEPVSFVFDINVVKKGRTGDYNLLPVISESGVAGKDVDVEEIEEDDADDTDDDDAETDNADEPNDGDESDDTNSTAQGGSGSNTTAEGGNQSSGTEQ